MPYQIHLFLFFRYDIVHQMLIPVVHFYIYAVQFFLQGQHGDLYYVMVSGVLDLFAAPNHAAAAENLENHSSRNFVSRVPDDFNHSDFGNRVASLYPVSKKKTKNMAFGKYTCLFLFSCFMRLPSRRLI